MYDKKSKGNSIAADEAERRRKEAEERRDLCKAIRAAAHKKGTTACQFCDYTGTVSAICKETGNIYSFACERCEAAEQMGFKNYPMWKAERADHFTMQRSTGS